MKLELRSISLWSFIKISVFVNLIIGFIGGLIYAVFLGMFMSLFANLGGLGIPELEDADMPIGFLLIAMPIMMSLGAALFGTIWGIVCVLTYNLVTMLTGGLEINVNDVTVAEPQVASPQVVSPQVASPQVASPRVVPSPPATAPTTNNIADIAQEQPSAVKPPKPLDFDDDNQNPST
ncbi:MAG: hypothetical protein KOO62_03115 [candidate division Zixibacteria bacterium]|nr:hypothetical protein [candidate division Zixibacteria bacterium]